MPANKKHHYVPRFYLRNFAEDGRSVSLYNFRQDLLVKGANLKNQCYRDYFYGKDGVAEAHLGQLEGGLAELLRIVLGTCTLPPPFSELHEGLCVFTLLQYARTAYSADAMDDFADGMWKEILSKDARFNASDLNRVRIVNSDPANLAVSIVLKHYHLIADLAYVLLESPAGCEFVTSDNPVVFYNQLMEFERFGSSTGLVSKGLQIFFPLSPKFLLLFFDCSVYALNDRRSVRLSLSEKRDIDQINALQAAAALENLYFCTPKADIFRVAEMGKGKRRAKKTRITKFQVPDAGACSSQMIGGSREDVRTNLSLSFMRTLKPAKRWREERKLPGMKPVVVPRDQRFVDEHENFLRLSDLGFYKPTEFFKYLRERDGA
ncbi:MAG: DUF4238 domain-containing protein [Burkholderiales bacterium]|uniref:DUF4238 domain-containing protein n=1 Tax=Roseateles sp. TaxID=1971397 RepID=UPI000FBD4940|nr:MAG: DUF4238 domain-containing protein [Burkholderiales bacterium]